VRLFRIFDVAIKLGVRGRLIDCPAKISTLADVIVKPSYRWFDLRISCSITEGRNVPTRYVCESYFEIWRGATRVARDNRVTHINSATHYIPEHVRRHTSVSVTSQRTYIFFTQFRHCRVNRRA